MTPVLFKMADVNVGHLKVKVDLVKRWHPKVCKKRNPTYVCGYDRQFCPHDPPRVTVWHHSASDPRDRIVYPIYKLMIDSYNLCRENKGADLLHS